MAPRWELGPRSSQFGLPWEGLKPGNRHESSKTGCLKRNIDSDKSTQFGNAFTNRDSPFQPTVK